MSAELGALGALLAGLAFAFARTGIPAWIPPAPLVRFGIPSPLTGMTRSFVALAGGDVAVAFVFHPLGPVVFAACVAAPVYAVAARFGREPGWVAGGGPPPTANTLTSETLKNLALLEPRAQKSRRSHL